MDDRDWTKFTTGFLVFWGLLGLAWIGGLLWLVYALIGWLSRN